MISYIMFLYYIFLPMILYRFSYKYAKISVAYVGAVLVPIALPRAWM